MGKNISPSIILLEQEVALCNICEGYAVGRAVLIQEVGARAILIEETFPLLNETFLIQEKVQAGGILLCVLRFGNAFVLRSTPTYYCDTESTVGRC